MRDVIEYTRVSCKGGRKRSVWRIRRIIFKKPETRNPDRKIWKGREIGKSRQNRENIS